MGCEVVRILKLSAIVIIVILLAPILYTSYCVYMHMYIQNSYEKDFCTVLTYNNSINGELCTLYTIEECSVSTYKNFVGTVQCVNTFGIEELKHSIPLLSITERYHFPSHNSTYYTLYQARDMIEKWTINLVPVLAMLVGLEVCILFVLLTQIEYCGLDRSKIRCKCCCKFKRKGRVIEYH